MPRLFTYFMCAAIVATLAGGLGGSLQPARLLLAALTPLVLVLSPAGVKLTPVAKQALTMAILMVLIGGLSLAWTADVLGGLGMLLAVSVGALSLYIVTRSDLTADGVRLLMWAWVGIVGISLPIAFYEIATGNHFQFAFEDRVIGGIGEFPFASIFFGNYNDYSTWLCLAFPITMAAFFEAKKIHTKSIVMIINIAIVAIIIINTSRASLAYVSIVCLFYIFIFNSFRIFAAIFLVVLIPAVLIQYQGQVLDIFDLAVYRFEVAGAMDESYIQRSGLVAGGVRAIIESYGIGVGVGGFEEYINDNYPYLIPNPHNLLLEIGVNFGVIPLLLFVALLVRLFLVGFFRRDIPQGFRMSIMFGALSVPVIGAVPSQAIGYTYWWTWLATLIAMASVRMPGKQEGAASARPLGWTGGH